MHARTHPGSRRKRGSYAAVFLLAAIGTSLFLRSLLNGAARTSAAASRPRTFLLNSGERIPALGLGTWRADKGKVGNAVRLALESGLYRHVDCSPRYGNEDEIGTDAVAPLLIGDGGGGLPRHELYVTSKLWNTNHRSERVRPALLRTLRDLRVDYLDLYLMHWPVALHRSDEPGCDASDAWECDGGCCDDVSLVDTWRAMEELVREGLVRSIGVSNFGVAQLRAIIDAASIPPAVNQVEMHPYLSQQQLVDFCREKNVLVVAYCPLGSPGNAAMPYAGADGEPPPPKLVEHPTVTDVAKQVRRTPAQVLLRWSIQRGVLPIPKSTNAGRLRENAGIWGWELYESHMEALNRLGDRYHVRYVPGNDSWRPAPSLTGDMPLNMLWEKRR